jgi:hypothetical protein
MVGCNAIPFPVYQDLFSPVGANLRQYDRP